MTDVMMVAVACAAACGGPAADRSSASAPQTQTTREPTVWSAANEPQQDVVLLQCRGGSGYEFKSLGFKASPDGAARVAVAMIFAPGSGAAGSLNEKLQPGTCAPSDRPLNADAPRELHFIAVAFAQPFSGPIDVTPTAAERHPDVRSIADYLKNPAHYWTFHAADTRRGYFDVTIHEHWEDRSTPPGQHPVDEPPDASAGRWLVRVSATGGIAGSRREVSINADGRLFVLGSGTFGNVRCSAEVPTDKVHAIDAATARSHPEAWLASYVPKGNPDGCCDQFRYAVHVEREDERGGRTSHDTYWFDQSAGTVPEGVSALFKSVYESRSACVF